MTDIGSLAKAADNIEGFASSYFSRLRAVLGTLDLGALHALAEQLDAARREGRTIFVAGNGGSATTATSMANDLGFDILKKTPVKRTFRIHALTDNVAAITAISNDVGYEDVFVNQLSIHYEPGDMLIVISASGNSPNVVAAAEWVKGRGGVVAALLGFSGGRLGEIADINLHFATEAGEYGPVEDAHLVVNHILAHWFQARFSGS